MDDPLYRTLKYIAISLTVLWLGWTIYDSSMKESTPGENVYHAANKYFEDGDFTEALSGYDQVLQLDPNSLAAMHGKALTLMQLNRLEESLTLFNEVISREPTFAGTYANRGILNDRIGRYRAAIKDYEKALELDPEIAEGPNWLTRFLRLQAEKPPTIADRAQYLRQQLAKPESERVLRIPKEDTQQRSYKM